MSKLFEEPSVLNSKPEPASTNKKGFFAESPKSIRGFLIAITLLAFYNITGSLHNITHLNPQEMIGLIISVAIIITQSYIAFAINKIISSRASWVIYFFWGKFALEAILSIPAILIGGSTAVFFSIGLAIDLLITVVLIRSFNRFFAQTSPQSSLS